MPLISLIVGGKSVADWKWVLTAAENNADGTVKVAENALRYGAFIQNIIDFLIVAFSIFVVLRVFTKLQKARKKNEAKEGEAEEEKKDA